MPTLTSLPLSLLSRILSHLCDLEGLKSRANRRLTNDYIPNRHPAVEISLDGVRTVNSPFPSELLSPALASPVLAAAAQKFVQGRLSYLTDMNTEARLSCWVDAFSEYVKAIAIIDDGKTWRDDLSRDLRKRIEEKLCSDTADLFRTIAVNNVSLKVLDVVNVPFDTCVGMEDEMMTGLCATLETCQTTLQELALPVYRKPNLCTRALATVSLPHLTVFSIELRGKLRRPSREKIVSVSWQFLHMMRAVDGHADRLKGLTSLKELRLINLHGVPCTMAKGSGCSAGFFRAIKTLRVIRNSSILMCPDYYEAIFCSLFRELECFYCPGSTAYDTTFLSLSKRLKEVHLCHQISRTGERVKYSRDSIFDSHRVCDAIHYSQGKIRTLVACRMYPRYVRKILKRCPNLEHLSLHVTAENMDAFGKFLQKCSRLTKLEVFFRDENGRIGGKRLLEMGRLIPGPSNLRELEFRMGLLYGRRGEPIDVLVNCLIGIIKRTGASLERLLFRLCAKHKTATQSFDALCRIMDCCADHSRVLTHLDVNMTQDGFKCSRLSQEDIFELRDAWARLRSSKEKLVESQPYLNKIDLGSWHCFLHDSNWNGGAV